MVVSLKKNRRNRNNGTVSYLIIAPNIVRF